MNRIEKLIEELCPDGVEYKPMGEVGEFIRGNGLQKKDFRDEGFSAIHYGQIYTKYGLYADSTFSFVDHDLANKLRKAKPGDVVIATTSENDDDLGKAVAWIGKNEVAVSGDAFIYKSDLDAKYISYFISSNLFHSQKKKYVNFECTIL